MERKVQSESYTGDCRRKGNGRLRLSFRDIWIVGIALVSVVGWLVRIEMIGRANADNYKDVKETPKQIELVQKDISYIKDDIGELNGKIEKLETNMDKGFKEVLEEIRNNR